MFNLNVYLNPTTGLPVAKTPDWSGWLTAAGAVVPKSAFVNGNPPAGSVQAIIDSDQQLANDTSAYAATYDNFRYKFGLYKDDVRIAEVEDLRVVWHNLKKAQCKFRVTKLYGEDASGNPLVVAQFNKTDNIKIVIETKAVAHDEESFVGDIGKHPATLAKDKHPERKLSMEPGKTFTPDIMMGEPAYENNGHGVMIPVTIMTIAPNKWLFFAGVFADA
jgi:hypothetical protein